jgi:hypothetical protein
VVPRAQERTAAAKGSDRCEREAARRRDSRRRAKLSGAISGSEEGREGVVPVAGNMGTVGSEGQGEGTDDGWREGTEGKEGTEGRAGGLWRVEPP